MNTETIRTTCPQCGKQSELILTVAEAMEAREKGWYVSCPKCQAAYIHRSRANDDSSQ